MTQPYLFKLRLMGPRHMIGTGKYTHSLIQQSLLTMLRSSRLCGPTDGDSFEACIELTYEAVSFIERVCYEKVWPSNVAIGCHMS